MPVFQHRLADLQASVSESVKQALHKQKVAHQAAAQAAVAGPAQQTDTQISQQAGDGKECVSTDVAEGLCSSATSSMSHGAAQPPASLPEAGMRPARQGSAAATSADTTSTAKAATPGSRRRTQQSADISTATQTACTTPEQQPQPQLQQQQQQAPEAQALQVASVVTNTLGLLPNSASDHVQIADATKAPLQPCCLQTPPAEGSVGMFSQPAKAHKGSVGLETLASDAHLAAEPAGRQEVMGTSLQQAEKKRSMAHMSAAARPQLWQVSFHLCCASILLFCVCVWQSVCTHLQYPAMCCSFVNLMHGRPFASGAPSSHPCMYTFAGQE